MDPHVLIVSALRNEGPYVLDWIAHYMGAGAQSFLLYTNDCDDGTDQLLDLLAAQGIVEHHRHSPPPDESVQWHAFRAAWKSDARKQADWALVCDVDEYINIHAGQTFTGLLSALPEGTEAMTLPWRLFGADLWSAAPVTERNLRAMSDGATYPIATTQFKTLLKVSGPFNQFGVHRPSEKKDQSPAWVCGAGHPLALPPQRLSLLGFDAGRALAEMNHYALRSPEEFILKQARGLPHHRQKPVDLCYWVERNFQTIEDRSIAAMAPASAAAKARLMEIPGVAEAHACAIDWHRATFERAMKDEATYRLYTHLRLSGPSRELPFSEATALYDRYQRL